MAPSVKGIHHITAYASDAQENLDFYTDLLGLRFTKKTLLFSNPAVVFEGPPLYHLYYGNRAGDPGSVMTFKPPATPDAVDTIPQGEVGRGQATAVAYTIPEGSVEYWRDRLRDRGVTVHGPKERFGDEVLQFRDHDGLPVELIPGGSDLDPWREGPVPAEYAIRGFHGTTFRPSNATETGAVLELLGFEEIGQQSTEQRGDWTRYRSPNAERARYVDVYNSPNFHDGRWGSGVVHHVAFRVSNREGMVSLRERLRKEGYAVTSIKDRKYFHSMYFRGPNDINIEMTSDGPGFTVDESLEDLGTELKLPAFLEDRREELEERVFDLVHR